MRVDLVSTGDEILYGETVDTNTAYAAGLLCDHGFEVGRHHTCGDQLADLIEILTLTLHQADAVICCGGLGPTQDDRTAEAVAAALGVALRSDPELLQHLMHRLQKLGVPFTDNQRRQARLPEGSTALLNFVGTAPGIQARHNNHLLFCLPGPPAEYRPLLSQQVLQRLVEEKTRRGDRQATARRTLRVFGKGEAWVENALGNLEDQAAGLSLGFQAVQPEVHIKLRAREVDPVKAEQVLNQAERLARKKLGDLIYAVDEKSLAATVIEMLSARHKTLAIAESCTGGLVGKILTDIPGSSAVLLLSAVTYADQMKERLLGVPIELLQTQGAVSAACAQAMAEGVRRLSGSDLSLALTGIAGPSGGTDEKPVGTVFFAVSDRRGTVTKQRFFSSDDRSFIRLLSATTGLSLLRKRLLEEP